MWPLQNAIKYLSFLFINIFPNNVFWNKCNIWHISAILLLLSTKNTNILYTTKCRVKSWLWNNSLLHMSDRYLRWMRLVWLQTLHTRQQVDAFIRDCCRISEKLHTCHSGYNDLTGYIFNHRVCTHE